MRRRIFTSSVCQKHYKEPLHDPCCYQTLSLEWGLYAPQAILVAVAIVSILAAAVTFPAATTLARARSALFAWAGNIDF